VIKHYLRSALKCISDTDETVDQHNRKVVQINLLARNFASQLQAEIKASLRSKSTTLAKHVLILHILWPRRQSVWHISPMTDQRTGYDLFDPEIAYTDLLDDIDKQYLYCTGNLSQDAISAFVKDHTCSVFCNLLGLPAIEH